MSMYIVTMRPGYQRSNSNNCALVCGAADETEARADFERLVIGEYLESSPVLTGENSVVVRIGDDSRYSCVFAGCKAPVGPRKGTIHASMLPAGQRLPA